MMERAVLRPGDWVCFDGGEHQVVGLAGTSVRLRSEAGEQVVPAGYLMAAADFAVIGAGAAPVGVQVIVQRQVRADMQRWRSAGGTLIDLGDVGKDQLIVGHSRTTARLAV
ncbi:hypothetical protein AB0L65_21375 [Nonomuraea sp. NPDC052116]|uniref:hypothetical protein n=1 Tax=Nonomuraea sp. NPDC052116 TaxID=3155665 RepID=UPI00344264B1